ncbi:MAG: exodeoxyribonuclease III [Phycisphaerales bacterium]
MRVLTWNINGIRSAWTKGLSDRLHALDADVVLLQEVRALPEQAPAELFEDSGYHVVWNAAAKKGYAGTALLTRTQPKSVSFGLGHKSDADDDEGRMITANIGGVFVSSVYLPSGSSGEHRQAVKDEWLPEFHDWALPMRRKRTPVLLGGDLNVAHTERDIFHWKSNQKTSGFLPHERAWFGGMLEAGWHDVIREKHGEVDGPYSWWSNRGQARALDRGWRIDYVLANPAARKRLKDCWIDRDAADGISDHAPVVADLDLTAG